MHILIAFKQFYKLFSYFFIDVACSYFTALHVLHKLYNPLKKFFNSHSIWKQRHCLGIWLDGIWLNYNPEAGKSCLSE
jgi:hypothetical protein